MWEVVFLFLSGVSELPFPTKAGGFLGGGVHAGDSHPLTALSSANALGLFFPKHEQLW